MSRKDGILLVEKYDGVCHDDIIISYCNYVGISFDEFWAIAYEYVNFNIFKIIPDKVRPEPKFKVGVNYEN